MRVKNRVHDGHKGNRLTGKLEGNGYGIALEIV